MAGISRQIGWSQESNLLYYILQQLTKLTSVIFNLKPKYKVFTALLYQSGDDSKGDQNLGPVTKGITYEIVGNDGDYSNVGAPDNNDGTKFIAINDEVPNSYGTGKLNYIIGAPVAIILENTIGNVWFEYDSVGNYTMYSNELFTEDKTSFFITPNWLIGDAGGYPRIQHSDINTITISTYDNGQSGSDDLLHNTPIEIRVYN